MKLAYTWKFLSVLFSGNTREESSIIGNIQRYSRATAEFVSQHTHTHTHTVALTPWRVAIYIVKFASGNIKSFSSEETDLLVREVKAYKQTSTGQCVLINV